MNNDILNRLQAAIEIKSRGEALQVALSDLYEECDAYCDLLSTKEDLLLVDMVNKTLEKLRERADLNFARYNVLHAMLHADKKSLDQLKEVYAALGDNLTIRANKIIRYWISILEQEIIDVTINPTSQGEMEWIINKLVMRAKRADRAGRQLETYK